MSNRILKKTIFEKIYKILKTLIDHISRTTKPHALNPLFSADLSYNNALLMQKKNFYNKCLANQPFKKMFEKFWKIDR